MNDENGMRPRDLEVHFVLMKNEKDIALVRMADGTVTVTPLTPDSSTTVTTSKQRARQQIWRWSRIVGLLLAFIYIMEVKYCSGAGSSTDQRCDRFPFALLTIFSCLEISLAEWFCVLCVLVTLRTVLATAKAEYLCYRVDQIAQRTIGWDYLVKYGYRHQRTTRVANLIAQEIRRSVREDTFVLVRRALIVFFIFQFVLQLFLHVFQFVLQLFLCELCAGYHGYDLARLAFTFVVISSRVVLEMAVRVMGQYQFALEPNFWLVYRILHS